MATNEPALVTIDETTPIIINGLPTRASINITELHRYINRCDIVKDANVNPMVKPKTEKSLFGRAANALFPIKNSGEYFNGSLSVLKSIKKAVFDNNFLGGSLGEPPESIESLKMSSALKSRLKRDMQKGDQIDFNEKSLPETYQFSFHDTGDSPTLIQSGIKQILTPGSYIDPASRDKEVHERLPNASSTDLSKYGFQNLKFSWEWVGTGNEECKITLNMKIDAQTIGDIKIDAQTIVVNETRNKNHKHKGSGNKDDRDYFEGNRLKNEWFGEKGNQDTTTAMKYLLCKELGDTTQATFMRLIMETVGSPYNTSNSCLFTLDSVLALRARLLGLPCCAKDHGGKDDIDEEQTEEVEPGKEDESPESETKFRRLLFYRPPIGAEQIKKARNSLMVKEAIKHNNAVKFAITKILSGGFYIGSDAITPQSINAYIRDYFSSIRDMIDIVNSVLTGIANSDSELLLPEAEFRQMIAYMRANELFKLKRSKYGSSYSLNTGLRNLFLYDNSEFYTTNITPKFSESRKNQDTNVYKNDILMNPSLDVIANFRDKIFAGSAGRKTFYEHFSYLKTVRPKDMDSRIINIIPTENQSQPVSGGAILYTQSLPSRRRTAKSRKTSSRSRSVKSAKRYKEAYGPMIKKYKEFYNLYKLDTTTALPPTMYNKDTIDLLWLLYRKLIINPNFFQTNYSQYSKTNKVDRYLDYMEDFLLFLYPYFVYLGEATYDIKHLQRLHDMFYVTNNNYFHDIVGYYVVNILNPRIEEMEKAGDLVLQSNQDTFLNKFKEMKDKSLKPVPVPALPQPPKQVPVSTNKRFINVIEDNNGLPLTKKEALPPQPPEQVPVSTNKRFINVIEDNNGLPLTKKMALPPQPPEQVPVSTNKRFINVIEDNNELPPPPHPTKANSRKRKQSDLISSKNKTQKRKSEGSTTVGPPSKLTRAVSIVR